MNTSDSPLSIEALFGVSGKKALVTGGSSGIGRMIAHALVANGAEVMITSRTADDVEATRSELAATGSCTATVADITTEDGRETLVAAVGEWGGLDNLVKNAGMAVPESLSGADATRSAAMLELNVTAPLLLTQALLDHLRASATAQDPGRVIMIGSVDGIRVPVTPLFTYGASKAAVHSLTRQLAHSLAGDHINVNAIAPGMFESAMTQRVLAAPGMLERIESGIPAGRIGAPEDIAGAVLFLTGRGGAYLTGALVPVDGGVSTTHG
jgi:NAD(P)-dependent dehydrogenase (short-subunit alcohol dehydrogenase family)